MTITCIDREFSGPIIYIDPLKSIYDNHDFTWDNETNIPIAKMRFPIISSSGFGAIGRSKLSLIFFMREMDKVTGGRRR